VDALPGEKDLYLVYRTLANYFQIAYGEGEFSSYSFNFTEFCKTYNLPSAITYNALSTLDRLGILQLSKQFGRRSALRFIVPSEVLLAYFEKDVRTSLVGKTILRVYGGIFETTTAINLSLIASKISQTTDMVVSALKKMAADAVAEVQIHDTDAVITFLVPREDEKTIYRLAKDVEELNEKKVKQVAAMLRFVENDNLCKSEQLLRYFGEEVTERCGICSVCTQNKESSGRSDLKRMAGDIMEVLSNSEMNSREISERLTFAEQDLIKVLRALLDAKRIGLNSKNEYFRIK
jgi:ATP-dependent DNA helicase RecQ